MESSKRKAVARVLDGRHLQRLPKVRDRLSSLSGLMRTESRSSKSKAASVNLLDEQPHSPPRDSDTSSSWDKRRSMLDFPGDTIGGSGLDIDLRSLEAFRNADESWFGSDKVASARGARQGKGKQDDKTSTPIADQFSKAEFSKAHVNGSLLAPVLKEPLPPPAPAPAPATAPPPASASVPPPVIFHGAPKGGREWREKYFAKLSGDAPAVESRPASPAKRPGSVLERKRAIKPRPSRERVNPRVEPIRIKLATTSESAEQKPPPLEEVPKQPARKTHARRKSQHFEASILTFETGAASAHAATTTPSPPKSPRRSGISVKTHIRRRSQIHTQITEDAALANKLQTTAVGFEPAVSPGTSTFADRRKSLHTTPAPLAETAAPLPATPGRPPLGQDRRQSWSTAPSPTPAPGGLRRNASTRASGGVNRLAWIKELEERKDSSISGSGLARELRKVQGSVADKLARFETIGRQAEAVVPVQRKRSDSVTSSRSYMTGSGTASSRPGSWYFQGGSAVASSTTPRTSIDSHRPRSVLENYDESFREKMQAVVGNYTKKDEDEAKQVQSATPNGDKSGQKEVQAHKDNETHPGTDKLGFPVGRREIIQSIKPNGNMAGQDEIPVDKKEQAVSPKAYEDKSVQAEMHVDMKDQTQSPKPVEDKSVQAEMQVDLKG